MLRAGAAKVKLHPRVGADMVGYFGEQVTIGSHDDIYVRVLALDDGTTALALCSIEICVLPSLLTAHIRQGVAELCDLPPEHVFIFTTHTHSAPALHNPHDWEQNPVEAVVQAIVLAYQKRQPARIGAGFGQLTGYSINRRWMNRPVDPSVAVLRVENTEGKPLAVFGNWANHAVVLGPDNNKFSGDHPGASSRLLEAQFGGDFVALFSQGGAGDVNPLTESVRQRMAAGHPVKSIGGVSAMYGTLQTETPEIYDIGDRSGGTPAEAEVVGMAYYAEVLRVWQSIHPREDYPLWVKSLTVNAAPADEPPIDNPQLLERYQSLLPEITGEHIPLEVMLVGIGDAVLVGHPGETFSENAVELRKACQQMGITHPILVTYANGWYSYLAPENAYLEGGYEVSMAQAMGISRRVQNRLFDAVMDALRTRDK